LIQKINIFAVASQQHLPSMEQCSNVDSQVRNNAYWDFLFHFFCGSGYPTVQMWHYRNFDRRSDGCAPTGP